MPTTLNAVREALAAELTVPTPGGDTLTWGDILNDDSLQKLLNMLHGTAKPTMAVMHADVAQAIADTTQTQVAFDTAEIDTDGLADTANDRIVIQEDGTYLLGARVEWNASNSGWRFATIELGSSNVVSDRRSARDKAESSPVSPPTVLSAGDLITLDVYQTTGASLDLRAHTRLWAVRISQ